MPTPGPAASHGTDDSLVPPRVDATQEVASTSDLALSFTIAHLRQSWKWASISQFLYQFEPILGLNILNLEAIEHDLTSPSTTHIVPLIRGLLHTLTLDRKITEENWETYFRKQYRRRAPAENPFGIVDGFEDDQPIHWTELDGPTKLNALHTLVEWHWASPNRIRGLMGIEEESPAWRLEPIGWDSKRNAYWVLGGTRLWVQHPRPGAFRPPKPLVKKVPKSRKGKGKRAGGPEPAPDANGNVWRKGRPKGSLNNGRTPIAPRGTRSRPPPPSDLEPPAKRARLTRTSRNSRRSGDDDEWQSIPDEWLANGGDDATPKANRRMTRSKKVVKDSVSSEAEAGTSALFDDDLSDLTSISDSEPAQTEDDEEKAAAMEDEEIEDKPYVEDNIELSTAQDPGFLEWEIVCATQQEWEAMGTRFATSKHKGEKALHRILNATIIPGVITALQDLEVKLRPPPPPEPEPEALGGRKRSSRIAIKEIQAEEARAQDRKKREEEELEQRLLNGDNDARIDDNDRTKRTAAREARRKAHHVTTEQEQITSLTDGTKKKSSTMTSTAPDGAEGNMEVDYDGEAAGDEDSQSEYQDSIAAEDPDDDDDDGDDFEPDTPPKSRSRGGRRTRSTATTNPRPVVRSKDDWLLECDICGKNGWNVDDGSQIACCERCNKWQHVECHNAADRAAGRALRNWEVADFICGRCQRRAQQRLVQATMPGLNPHHMSYTQVAAHNDPRAAYFSKAPPLTSAQAYNLYPNAAYYSGVGASMSPHPVPVMVGNMTPHPLNMGHPIPGATAHLSMPMQQPPSLQSAYATPQHIQHYQPRPTHHPNLKDVGGHHDMYAPVVNGGRPSYHAAHQNPYPQVGNYAPPLMVNNLSLANNHAAPINHTHVPLGASIRGSLPLPHSPAHQLPTLSPMHQQPPPLGSALQQSLTPMHQQRPLTPTHSLNATPQQQQQHFPPTHQQRPLTPAQQQQMVQLLYANQQQRGLPTPPPSGLSPMSNVGGMNGMNGNGMNGHWSGNGHLPVQVHHQPYIANGPLSSQGYPGVHASSSMGQRYAPADHLHAPPVTVAPPASQYYTPATNR